MKKIIAVIKTKWIDKEGFIFNTDIQSDVENFMLKLHYGSDEYILMFDDQKIPKGSFTEVNVNHDLGGNVTYYSL